MTLFDEGEVLYQAGDYTGALAKYQESYQESGWPELLFNLGQCQRQLGQRDEAIRFYRQFLEKAPKSPYRPEVERKIREMESATTLPALQPPNANDTLPPQMLELVPVWALWAPPATFGLVGAGSGIAALVINNRLQENPSGDNQSQRSARFAFALVSDLSFVTGIALSGRAIFQSWRQDKLSKIQKNNSVAQGRVQ